MSEENTNPTAKLDRFGIGRVIQVIGLLVIIGAILFGCAGD